MGPSGPNKLWPLFSLFPMRKLFSSGQKWFRRPYFPLIRGMCLLRRGLRFSFQAIEVPEPRVRKGPPSLTKMAFSSRSVWAHICQIWPNKPNINILARQIWSCVVSLKRSCEMQFRHIVRIVFGWALDQMGQICR